MLVKNDLLMWATRIKQFYNTFVLFLDLKISEKENWELKYWYIPNPQGSNAFLANFGLSIYLYMLRNFIVIESVYPIY